MPKDKVSRATAAVMIIIVQMIVVEIKCQIGWQGSLVGSLYFSALAYLPDKRTKWFTLNWRNLAQSKSALARTLV